MDFTKVISPLEQTEADIHFAEYSKIMTEEALRIKNLKDEYKINLKGLINITGLYRTLDDEMSEWTPVGIVEVILTDEKRSGYSNYQHGRIVDDKDKLLYMKQDENDIRGVKHCYVWQMTGFCEDDYSGYCLYPLKDGKYFKISYSC